MNYLSLKKTLCKNIAFIFFFIMLAVMIQSCEDNPNDLGFNFIPNIDTTITRYLDSQTDTMNITSNNYKQFVNTFGSQNLLVGLYQGYTSKSLLKFISVPTDLDSATISSAVLTLRYSDYFFKEETGVTSFSIFKVNTNFGYSTVTYDSVTPSSIGNISQGSYSGSPIDTQTISVTLNNQLAKDWLEYSADSSYAEKNYGVILQPNAGSTNIKGFYSFNNAIEFVPYVTVIFTKLGVTDTLVMNTTDYVSLSDAPSSIIPADRFVLQNGIAFRNIMNFDLTKLPSNVIINNATLILYLDKPNSFISPNTDKRLIAGMVLDSVTKKDSLFTEIFPLDSVTYSISSPEFNAVFQRWNLGQLPNLGITLKNFFELQNLDNFVIYSSTTPDVTKRPRLKITYTPRN